MVYDKPVPLPIFEGYEVRNGIAVDVVLVRMDPGVRDVEQYGWIIAVDVVLVRMDPGVRDVEQYGWIAQVLVRLDQV